MQRFETDWEIEEEQDSSSIDEGSSWDVVGGAGKVPVLTRDSRTVPPPLFG